MQDEFKIGRCTICGVGQQIIMRDVQSATLIIECDECLSQWSSPELAMTFVGKPNERNTIEKRSVVLATAEDIKKFHWEKWVVEPHVEWNSVTEG